VETKQANLPGRRPGARKNFHVKLDPYSRWPNR
jgi:hypothetical protein